MSRSILRHGAYICLHVPHGQLSTIASVDVTQIITRLGLSNEFDAEQGHPLAAVGFLRRVSVTPADITDPGASNADAVIHVAAPTAAPIDAFRDAMTEVLGGLAELHILGGVVRETQYTGGAMHQFAYAQQLRQQPGSAMPHAFLLPMRKTAEWWAKGWMERHTYFLPRFDESGRQVSEGHALVAAPGIPYLMRRTYQHVSEPAPEDAYDFLTYFECADDGVAPFRTYAAPFATSHVTRSGSMSVRVRSGAAAAYAPGRSCSPLPELRRVVEDDAERMPVT